MKYGPCLEARLWLAKQDNAQQAWNDCREPEWMLWLLGTTVESDRWGEDRKPLVSLCIDIVKQFEPKSHQLDGLLESLREWNQGVAKRLQDYPRTPYIEAIESCVTVANGYYYCVRSYICDLTTDRCYYPDYQGLTNIIRKHYPRSPYE